MSSGTLNLTIPYHYAYLYSFVRAVDPVGHRLLPNFIVNVAEDLNLNIADGLSQVY